MEGPHKLVHIQYLSQLEERINELENLLEQIPHFDDGYTCLYCGNKTYGTGKSLTCDHSSDCIWILKEKALNKKEK